MASLATACRLGARCAAQNANGIGRRVATRDLSSSSRRLAAHNFVMPAMSPTMTEGNIASWKVKEGDSFSTGDILLEIETDKAQMDVEAQDDGIMAKIISQDGSKSVKVGTRIAVLADPEDDIKTLEIPPDDSPAPSAKKETSQPSETQQQEQQQSQKPKSSEQESSSPKSQNQPELQSSTASQPKNQRHTLLPSVQFLLHTNGISAEDASKIPPTGPSGRLSKGDVLAYLGTIDKSSVDKQAERMHQLSKLDLSNIQKAQPKSPSKEDTSGKAKAAAAPERERGTEVAVPISLAAVFRMQNKMHESLGVDLPLATFIARASEIANENLPRPTGAAASADDLFDDILASGARRRPRGSRGFYIPEVTPLPPPTGLQALRLPPRKVDIIDILAGKKPKVPAFDIAADDIGVVPGGAGANNVFSLSVSKGEEKRARVYLERVKSVLEAEPGRCVL